jgi:hypothetical protein
MPLSPTRTAAGPLLTTVLANRMPSNDGAAGVPGGRLLPEQLTMLPPQPPHLQQNHLANPPHTTATTMSIQRHPMSLAGHRATTVNQQTLAMAATVPWHMVIMAS